MGKHLFIAGHGRRRNGIFDPGATGIISKGEHRYIKEDLFPTMKKFLPKDHDVIFFDRYNVYDHENLLSLAKQYNADQVTEVHYDAAGASASGGHVIIHSDYKPDKTDLALRDAIQEMVGIRYNHRGYAGISGRSNLANVNHAAKGNLTYRLIELGFGTNVKDAKIMTEDIEAYAKALVEAVTGSSSNKKPVKKKTSTTKKSSNTGVVWVGTNDKGKRVESIYKGSDGLNFYDSPRWDNPSGSFGYGMGWKVGNKYLVDASPMYRVQNSKGDLYFITASPNYVRIDGNSKVKPKGDMLTTSVVDYLNSIDVDSDFSNRKRLATMHGIKNYKGTANQNSQLLRELRR